MAEAATEDQAIEAPVLDQEPLNETWYHWVQSEFTEFLNPDDIPIETYEEMLKDETVFSGMEFLRQTLLSRLGEYSHPVPRIEKRIRENLVQLEGGSFLKSCGQILTGVDFGYSVTEKLWKRDNSGQVRLRGLQTLHPSSVSVELHTSGPHKNRPKVVYQWKSQGTREKEFDLSKIVLFTHGEWFGNVYGRSRLRAAYAAWFTKKVIVPAWGLMMERFGSPIAIGKTDSEKKVKVNGLLVSAKTALSKMLAKLGARGQIVTDTKTEIDIVRGHPEAGKAFEGITAYCNKMIYRAIGLPSLIADHGDTGSYSLGQEHSALFHLVQEQIGYELADTLVQQIVKPLIIWNFGEQKLGYGEFTIENFAPEKALQLATYFEKLIDTGLVKKHKLEDMNEMRSQLGWTALLEEDLEEPLSLPPTVPPQDLEDDEASAEELSARSELALCFSAAGKRRAKAALVAARQKRLRVRRELEEFGRAS